MSSSYLRGLNMAAFFVASKIILFITFTVFVLVGNEITASSVFVAMSLFGAVRLTVTLFFPSAIEKVAEARISVRRIKVKSVWVFVTYLESGIAQGTVSMRLPSSIIYHFFL